MTRNSRMNHSLFSLVQSLTLIACLMPIVARADSAPDLFKLGTSETPTAVSGYAGAWKELGKDSDYQTLRTILWGEKTDDPCGLFIDTAHINTSASFLDKWSMPSKPNVNPYVYGKFEIDTNTLEPRVDSAGHVTHAEYVKLDCNGNSKMVSSMGNDKHIYKLSVCTTDKKNSYDNKLKGLRVWSRTLTYKNYQPGQTPELIDEPTAHEALHTNCEVWHTPVACEKGEVATRLRVHYNDTGHRWWATGISLVCKKVLIANE